MPRKRPIRYPTGVRPAAPDVDGSPRWTLRWRRDGHEHSVIYAAPTADEAAQERARRIVAGTPYASKGPGGLTVRRAVERFLETRETHSTRIQDSGNLARLTAVHGSRALRSITAPELREWLDGLRKVRTGERYDANSLMAFRRSCRALWSWAIERGHADVNPARDLQIRTNSRARGKGPAPAAKKRHLELEELRALFGWLGENAPPSHAMIFRTQLRLGLRIGEACVLRRDLIDWDAGVVTIDRAISQGELSPTKKGKRSEKYLSPQGRGELRRWLDENPDRRTGYVFVKPRRLGDRWPFYAPRYVRITFNEALEALGGFGLDARTTTHALRHSWDRIAADFVHHVGAEELAQILGNRKETAATFYSAGPGPMARAIADHLEKAVFTPPPSPEASA